MVKIPMLLSAIAGLAISAWTPFTFVPRLPVSPVKLKSQVSEGEIIKLVEQLSDTKFSVRQAAMKRLTEIGVPALSILENAEESNDLELRLRASALVKSIREANRPSVRVNGMEFTLETDFKWRRPSEVHVTRFNLTVRAKNISDTIYRFGLTKVSIVLTDSTGQSPKALPIWLRGTLLPPIHPAMAKNDALAFSLDASLVKENDNVMLHWNDPLSFSQFGPLADKTYSVALAFESSLPTQNADGSGIRMPEFSDSTYWLGKVQTPSERIQIR